MAIDGGISRSIFFLYQGASFKNNPQQLLVTIVGGFQVCFLNDVLGLTPKIRQ